MPACGSKHTPPEVEQQRSNPRPLRGPLGVGNETRFPKPISVCLGLSEGRADRAGRHQAG